MVGAKYTIVYVSKMCSVYEYCIEALVEPCRTITIMALLVGRYNIMSTVIILCTQRIDPRSKIHDVSRTKFEESRSSKVLVHYQ